MAGCTVALACAGSEPPAKAPNDAPRVRDRVVPSLDVAGATATADAPQAAAARLEPPGPDARSGGRGLANPRHGNARDRHGRVASLRYITWIYARADVRSKKLGYIRAGTSIALRQSARVDGWGNCRGFYAVEPRGFVCNDDSATADLGHPDRPGGPPHAHRRAGPPLPLGAVARRAHVQPPAHREGARARHQALPRAHDPRRMGQEVRRPGLGLSHHAEWARPRLPARRQERADALHRSTGSGEKDHSPGLHRRLHASVPSPRRDVAALERPDRRSGEPRPSIHRL